MDLMPDVTNTCCPYCGGTTQYVYRKIELSGLNPYGERIKAVEIYCASCHRTLSITPIMPLQ